MARNTTPTKSVKPPSKAGVTQKPADIAKARAAKHIIEVDPPKAAPGHPQAHTVTRDKASGIEKFVYSDGSHRLVPPNHPGHSKYKPVAVKAAATAIVKPARKG